MAAPTDNEKTLANRITDALGLLKLNGADASEQEYYVAETLAEYRQTIKPHGKSEGQRVTDHKHSYAKHWMHADKLIMRGRTAEAREYIKKNVKTEHVLPSSRLVIRVMMACLNNHDEDLNWTVRSGG